MAAAAAVSLSSGLALCAYPPYNRVEKMDEDPTEYMVPCITHPLLYAVLVRIGRLSLIASSHLMTLLEC